MVGFSQFLPSSLRHLPWRTHPLDGKLLLFDRDSGLNALLEGDETTHLRRVAPRSLLIALTNACDLACPFCYRDRAARSLWRYNDLMQLCREADTWGVLEVAFGGGEPLLFPGWAEFITELYDTTRLCVNFTTNGTHLTEDFLRTIAGKIGQIRLSLYEDNGWSEKLALLARCGTRFGVNWLITPAELPALESKFAWLLALGVRDFLLIGYKGPDAALHLNREQREQFARFVNASYQQFGGSVALKLDTCWGDILPQVPRLFQTDDCGAGDDILSITSDKRVKACSFQPDGLQFETIEDLRRIWEQLRQSRDAALIGGCARLPNRGLQEGDTVHAVIPMAAV